ncbi:MAG: sn-glycerol-3-phosphate ABC transporter ATP-binding protein UgpC [Clostridiales Family XIII bacterium]|jgi:multiple sugar transport system ATP-binding protein|nr:sn-glycerol-3-phosphate ABC transporter ATP-binding protein UgpC [Clostridiales Family XIII bacterium]
MSSIRFDDVVVTYPGNKEPSVHEFNLEIKDGEFVVLVGPSGCGKSTTLRALAGLETVTSGKIYINDKDVTYVHPKDRDIAMVFQNYALYPHMSVADNIGFSLKMAGVKKEERIKKIEEVAGLLKLSEYLKRKPKALSGGQRQRVAMGRAIVRNPNAFLMDEPLSNLDAKLRVSTRTQIAELQKKLKTSMVYVTHDQTEAMTMGDRIVIMKDGFVQQIGSPSAAYNEPTNVFVAGFIGSPAMNIGTFKIKDGYALITKTGKIKIPKEVLAKIKGNKITVGIRPEAFIYNVDSSKYNEDELLPVKISVVEYMGSDRYEYGQFEDLDKDAVMHSERIIVRIPGYVEIDTSRTINLAIKSMHLFDAETGIRIGGFVHD